SAGPAACARSRPSPRSGGRAPPGCASASTCRSPTAPSPRSARPCRHSGRRRAGRRRLHRPRRSGGGAPDAGRPAVPLVAAGPAASPSVSSTSIPLLRSPERAKLAAASMFFTLVRDAPERKAADRGRVQPGRCGSAERCGGVSMPAEGVRSTRDERGQALVIPVLFLVVLLGMAAATIDVGSWYRTHRQAQAAADAAALAAAPELPAHTTTAATSRALEYASKNGGGLAAGDITYSDSLNPGRYDTVTVKVRRPAPIFFSRVLGISSVTAVGRSTARAEPVSSVAGVAPITVHYKHPLLNCTQGSKTPKCNPTFGVTTTLTLSD